MSLDTHPISVMVGQFSVAEALLVARPRPTLRVYLARARCVMMTARRIRRDTLLGVRVGVRAGGQAEACPYTPTAQAVQP